MPSDHGGPVVSHRYGDPGAWGRAVVAAVAAALGAEVVRTGAAALVVPGGRTTAAVLPELARLSLPWAKITVVPADERWVAVDHPDSNEGLIRRLLAGTAAAAATLISLRTAAKRPAEAISEVSARLAGIPRPVAVVLLGMGEDGHIASLFPHDPAAATAVTPCLPVDRPDHPRLSLSVPTLLNSRRLVLALFGAAKLAVLEQARQPGSALELPVRHLLHQSRVPVTLVLGGSDGDGGAARFCSSQ